MIVSGPFEEACRLLFEDLPAEAIVSCEMGGGGEVQIGDMTWDYEDRYIEISAYVPGVNATTAKKHLHRYRGKTWQRRFESLPELWEALERARTPRDA